MTLAGTTSAQGVDTSARSARAADFYKSNPAVPSGGVPAEAVVLDANDDAATAAAKLMSGSEGDLDALAEVGASWGAIRGEIDTTVSDGNLSSEGKSARLGETYGKAAELIGQLRADAAEHAARADALEQRVADDLATYDDSTPEEKAALYAALAKMDSAALGTIFQKLCETPIAQWQRHHGQRVIAVLKLADIGASPVPGWALQEGWRALLAQSPHVEHVAAAKSRADILSRMAGSVEAAAMGSAKKTGHVDGLREQLGLNGLIPGRAGEPDVPQARVLDIPASASDAARWGRRGR